MVHTCVVPNCKESSRFKKSNITFHVFPIDPIRRKKWIEAINRENFIPAKYTSICSKHFRPSNYVGNRLLKDAVPTLFEFPDLHSIRDQLRDMIVVAEAVLECDDTTLSFSPEPVEATTSGDIFDGDDTTTNISSRPVKLEPQDDL